MPNVSIIIVCWNSANYLPKCLSSLKSQTCQEFEVILVDNGSTDGSIDRISDENPALKIHIEKLSRNLGFAVANNIGARLARGQWLALLNADAFPEPNWLECLLEAANRFPNAFFASRQIQANAPELLDGEGDVYHISGLAWRRNYGFPIKANSEIEEIFSPCAAAALYPRQSFLDAGGFDEDFFSYHEDVDLGFRLRLNGLRCFYVPQSIVYHVGSASAGKLSDFVIYHGHRNLVWTYVKNVPSMLFWLFLPLHFVMTLYYLISFSIKGYGKTIWHAKIDATRGLGLMLHKRKYIQQSRRSSVANIYRAMERNLIAPLRILMERRWFENKLKDE